jgi:hypothetical protein
MEEIIENSLGVFLYSIEGRKYDIYYCPRHSRSNILFQPFMECLKKFRPDLKESYVKFEGPRTRLWFVIIGIIIFILILVYW